MANEVKPPNDDDDEFNRAQREWDQINVLPILQVDSQLVIDTDVPPFNDRTANLLDLETIDTYIKGLDISHELTQIKPVIERKGFLAFIRLIFFLNPPELRLKDERDRLFALALKSFDNHETIHAKFLTTIYQKLTKQPLVKCPRYGNHWEEIGFQGTDPATDLRGVGILGLYQLVCFILSAETSKLAQQIYSLSLDRRQQFPFCVMGTNVTQIAIQTLREGHLNKEFNKRGQSVIRLFNLFYAGLYYKLYQKWKSENKTIADAGFVLKDLRSEASKSVGKTIDMVLSPPKPNRSTYLEIGPESSVSGVTNTTDDNLATGYAGGGGAGAHKSMTTSMVANTSAQQPLKFTDLGNV